MEQKAEIVSAFRPEFSFFLATLNAFLVQHNAETKNINGLFYTI